MRGHGRATHCDAAREEKIRDASHKTRCEEDGVNPMTVNILVHSAWGAKAPVVLRTYQTE
jgi:hypothetical protein